MKLSRRRLLQSGAIFSGSLLMNACGTTTINEAPLSATMTDTISSHSSKPVYNSSTRSNNVLHLFASSGFCEDSSRVQRGIELLSRAGFVVNNQMAAFRRYQRFAGRDDERIADLQNIVTNALPAPKVLMGVRGGYGAVRLLPHIDWTRLADKMRESQTLLFGFSDVTAIQLALFAQGGGMPSFAGPMLYSEFAKPDPDPYTMESFIQTTTNKQVTVSIPFAQSHRPRSVSGIFWGGNLSVIASLVGTPYMPNIQGGILFLEDVSEQPYRIERMLQTLHLAGVLRQQQAIVLGDFRMGNIRDSYDPYYDLNSVSQVISRVTGLPIFTHFPFGHITHKTTFPLGTYAKLEPSNNGGYDITFSDYPVLDANTLVLNELLPPPPSLFDAIDENVDNQSNDIP